jgi:ligand-binding sensor domain-containing protein
MKPLFTYSACFFMGLILLLTSVNANPHEGSFSFHQLTVEEGLAGNSINAIAEDFTGYIWIGGDQGLSRFDGYEVKTYEVNPANPFDLPHRGILHLYCDSKGRIWVGTRWGLALYNHQLDAFTNFPFGINDPDQISAKTIRFINDEQGECGLLRKAAGFMLLMKLPGRSKISLPGLTKRYL